MDDQRYDVVYSSEGCTITPHYCREWDNDGGCYGMNPDHGMSFDDACDQVAQWHEVQAKSWRNRTAYDALVYSGSCMDEEDYD